VSFRSPFVNDHRNCHSCHEPSNNNHLLTVFPARIEFHRERDYFCFVQNCSSRSSLVPRTLQGSILLKLMQDVEAEVVLDVKMG